MSDTLYKDASFIEMLLGQLRSNPEVLKRAKGLKLDPSDFEAPGPYDLPVYKHVAALTLCEDTAPMDLRVSVMRLREMQLPAHLQDQVVETLFRLPTAVSQSATDFVLDNLRPFIKARRSAKIIQEAGGDIEKMVAECKKVIFPLDMLDLTDVATDDLFVSPFETILKKDVMSMISTGFTKLDAALGGGLGYREFGLIVGHSGGGKTALGTSIARGAAMSGKKVIYCSMEEQKEDIANRMYADVFNVNYTSLHNGSGYMELEQNVNEYNDPDRLALLKNNLRVLNLKGMTPVKCTTLKQMLDEFALKNNFIYDLLVIDQLQFMEPEEMRQGEQDWQREGRVVKEVDEMSHMPIGDTNHHYSIWLLHQAKGKVKIYFTTEEIAGFKGITHKPETVLGIGRENPSSNEFEVFSMKCRHAKNFRQPMHGDLTYMRFIEKAEAPGDAQSIGNISPAEGLGVKTAMSSGNFGETNLSQLTQPTAQPVATRSETGPPRPPAAVVGISQYG
jgi:archaellum biogenesis ATPase FlaH